MDRERFQYVCMESDAGRDVLVTHGSEGGMVDRCMQDHLLVKTPQGEQRCWDYRECEEVGRTREEFPWR